MTTADAGDELAIVDTSASTTKKISKGDYLKDAATFLNNNSIPASKTNFGGDYSTSEVNTGFTWVDGKVIYKKTINTGALPNSTNKLIGHGIANMDSAISISGFAMVSAGGVTIPLPYAAPTSINSVQVAINGSAQLEILTGINRTTFVTSFITIYYTKV